MRVRRRKTVSLPVAAPVADPRFPDYSKVTGYGYAGDREVQDANRAVTR